MATQFVHVGAEVETLDVADEAAEELSRNGVKFTRAQVLRAALALGVRAIKKDPSCMLPSRKASSAPVASSSAPRSRATSTASALSATGWSSRSSSSTWPQRIVEAEPSRPTRSRSSLSVTSTA